MELRSDHKSRIMHYTPPMEIQNTIYETVLQKSNLNLNLIKPLDLPTRQHRGQRNSLRATTVMQSAKPRCWGKLTAQITRFVNKDTARGQKEMNKKL